MSLVFLNSLPERRSVEEETMDVVTMARERLGFEPDSRQEEVLRWEAKRGMLLCSRQWGKSTVAAIKAVYRAYTRPKSLVLVASPSERQSNELVRKVAEFVAMLGIEPRGDGSGDPSVVLPNGSRIVGLPGREGTVRGFSSASLLLIDEAARVDDEMYFAMRPTLAVGKGDLLLMSTPWARRGFFYNTWEHASGPWMRMRVPATECPRIDREFLEEERTAMGAAVFGREYLCEFHDEGVAYFPRESVEGAFTDQVTSLDLGHTWRGEDECSF